MENKLIAVTGPVPDGLFRPGFDKNELHKDGAVFEDGFVSYYDMTVGQLEAVAHAISDDVDATMKEALVAYRRLSPEQREAVWEAMSPEERINFTAALAKFIERNQ